MVKFKVSVLLGIPLIAIAMVFYRLHYSFWSTLMLWAVISIFMEWRDW